MLNNIHVVMYVHVHILLNKFQMDLKTDNMSFSYVKMIKWMAVLVHGNHKYVYLKRKLSLL